MVKTNLIWFSVVRTLIDNDTLYSGQNADNGTLHSGQTAVDSQAAAVADSLGYAS